MDQPLSKLLLKGSYSIAQLASKLQTTEVKIRTSIRELKLQGYLIQNLGGQWHIAPTPVTGKTDHKYSSSKENTYLFGFIGDTHLCSKYERLDVLNDLYDLFELYGVDRVFHQGNWIDGECKLNRYELKVHGIDNQIDYLIEHYPSKKDIITYAIAGDDHEGWFGKAFGIDIGHHTELMMRNSGRMDWVNLGYMESYVDLINLNTKRKTTLLSMHPGGGSAYAISYRPQKIVESFQGGEKPSTLLIGHYHKMSYNYIRNVHVLQTGCTEDQTMFMRKKGLDAHVGGGICRLIQDPSTGQIISCGQQFFNYQAKGFRNNRWNYRGQVNQVERSL